MQLRVTRIFIPLLVLCAYIIPSSSLAASGHKAMKYVNKSMISGFEKDYKSGCLIKIKYGSEGCARYAAVLIVYYFNTKRYEKASAILPSFYKYSRSSSSQKNCPYGKFGLPKSKDNFLVGYYEAAYAVFNKIDKGKAKKYAIRAFMCAVDETHYFRQPPMTIADVKMGRDEFVSTMKSIYGNNSAFDADRIIEEIIIPLNDRTAKIRKGKIWGKDVNIDSNDSAKLSALLSNAIEYIANEGFNKEFTKYYVDLKSIYDNMVTIGAVREKILRK